MSIEDIIKAQQEKANHLGTDIYQPMSHVVTVSAANKLITETAHAVAREVLRQVRDGVPDASFISGEAPFTKQMYWAGRNEVRTAVLEHLDQMERELKGNK